MRIIQKASLIMLILSLLLSAFPTISQSPVQAQGGPELNVTAPKVIAETGAILVTHDEQDLMAQTVFDPMDFPADVYGKARTFTNQGSATFT